MKVMKLLKLLLVVFISYFVALPLVAAEAVLENQAEETTETQQVDGDELASDDSAAAIDSDSDEASEEESPSRFIPTEQISQDLGVSFPSDI